MNSFSASPWLIVPSTTFNRFSTIFFCPKSSLRGCWTWFLLKSSLIQNLHSSSAVKPIISGVRRKWPNFWVMISKLMNMIFKIYMRLLIFMGSSSYKSLWGDSQLISNYLVPGTPFIVCLKIEQSVVCLQCINFCSSSEMEETTLTVECF